MCAVGFRAYEYQADGSFKTTQYAYEGNDQEGWYIIREGSRYLDLPGGYRLLRSLRCGICATDLARIHLAFPLPQIIGHEIIAEDIDGRIVAVEINASHASIGSPAALTCPMCAAGLATHCPERMVLGIDRLPGGYGPWILAPAGNIVEVPHDISDTVAVLIEPFAAAAHALGSLSLHIKDARRVAVLGLGRLGLLVIVALAVVKKDQGASFTIEAIGRRPERFSIAEACGAEHIWHYDVSRTCTPTFLKQRFDIVIEATGSPQGLETALQLASGEVHVKSTTGRASIGLSHITELVVDEVSLGRFDQEKIKPAITTTGSTHRALVVGTTNADQYGTTLQHAGYDVLCVPSIEELGKDRWRDRLLNEGQAEIVVIDRHDAIDSVIRPWPGIHRGAVRPQGMIAMVHTPGTTTLLTEAILKRHITLSTSRCGDFRSAFPLLAKAYHIGIPLERIITDVFSAHDIPRAFARARMAESIKVVIEHPR